MNTDRTREYDMRGAQKNWFPRIVAGLAAFCLVAGLFLVLARDAKTAAQWSRSAATLALVEAQRDNVDNVQSAALRQQSYMVLVGAIAKIPYDPAQWTAMAYSVAARDGDRVRAQQSLLIAETLDPAGAAAIQKHRDNIFHE
jgi:hypothetical protein